MVFYTILVLISEPSTSTVRKIMITMIKFETFWNRAIFGYMYTGFPDGCNAENQTKKAQIASAH